MRKKRIVIVVVLLAVFLTAGVIYTKFFREEQDSALIPVLADELIYESTISPNEQYVTSKEDIVNYKVTVYQKDDDSIIVCASSNSAFFDELQYVIDYDRKISASDVEILWTTLMGNPESTEEDQIALATVSISSDNVVFSERKINFLKKGMDSIIDILDRNAD